MKRQTLSLMAAVVWISILSGVLLGGQTRSIAKKLPTHQRRAAQNSPRPQVSWFSSGRAPRVTRGPEWQNHSDLDLAKMRAGEIACPSQRTDGYLVLFSAKARCKPVHLAACAVPLHTEPSAQLDAWYAYYAHRYFKRMPTIHPVWADGLLSGDEEDYALTIFYPDPQHPRIYIAAALKGMDEVEKEALLHEMVHVEMRDSPLERSQHDKKFQHEMLRLAKRGAFADLW